jgi:preprotein translocase subunit SecB
MTNNTPTAVPVLDGKRVHLNAQYIKDLSFESPNPSKYLFGMKDRPGLQMGVDVRAAKLQDGLFEVTLVLRCKTLAGEEPIFLVELSYAGIFSLGKELLDDPQETLMVECVTLLYPFARRVVSDVTRDGGFPPLMLDAMDFAAMYRNRAEEEKAA